MTVRKVPELANVSKANTRPCALLSIAAVLACFLAVATGCDSLGMEEFVQTEQDLKPPPPPRPAIPVEKSSDLVLEGEIGSEVIYARAEHFAKIPVFVRIETIQLSDEDIERETSAEGIVPVGFVFDDYVMVLDAHESHGTTTDFEEVYRRAASPADILATEVRHSFNFDVSQLIQSKNE